MHTALLLCSLSSLSPLTSATARYLCLLSLPQLHKKAMLLSFPFFFFFLSPLLFIFSLASTERILFFSLHWSMASSDLSFSCSCYLSPLFEDLYTLSLFYQNAFQKQTCSVLSVLKINTCQNVLLTERYLQPSLTFFWSHNTYETPHTCCFRFVSFGHSGFFLDLKKCWCIFISHSWIFALFVAIYWHSALWISTIFF